MSNREWLCNAHGETGDMHDGSLRRHEVAAHNGQIITITTREKLAIDRDFLAQQKEFSERTFGPGRRTKGVVDHIRKELKEIEADPDDVHEWIDVVILGLDGAWRTGATPQQILDGIHAKFARNRARTWPDWRTADPDKAIEHDRTVAEVS